MFARKLTLFISHPSHCLTDHLPHGDGLIAFHFLQALAAGGHELHVAVPLQHLRAPLPANMHLYPIETRSPATAAAQSVPFRLEYAWRVRRLYDRLRRTLAFDCVHQLNPAVLGLSALLWKTGAPLVLGPVWPSWRDGVAGQPRSGRDRLARHLRQLLLRANFSRCDAVLAPTSASSRLLLEAGVPGEKLRRCSVGIDAQQFSPAAEPDPRVPTVLFLANLQERKGIYVLLEAFERVLLRVPEARLLVGGSGDEGARFAARVAQSPAAGSIQLLGNVARPDVAATLRRCSVYCLPSFGEPFGMSALEAMACGKPLVVTAAGGLADLVPAGGGLHVPPRDVPALARALETLLLDAAARRRMGDLNRATVLLHHTWSAVSNELTAVYRSLIEADFHTATTMAKSYEGTIGC